MSRRLKSLAGLVVDQADRGELPYLALEHLEGGTGAVVPDLELPCRRGGEPGTSAVQQGDVLFGKLRPYLAKTLLVREPAYASTELMALRPSSAVEARYLAYLVGSRPLIEWATASSDGTKMPRTSWEKLGEFRLNALPDLATQRAIADYLDTETARIDAIIAKKKRMIGLLDERMQSITDELLRAAETVPLKRLVWFQEGPGIMAEDFLEDGVPLIRVAGVGGHEVTLSGCNYLDPEKVRRRWSHFALREGDYVISASASIGIASKVGKEAAGAIPYTGLIRFKPASPDVDMDFIRYFLTSRGFLQQIDQLKTGAAMQHFGPSHLGQVVVPKLPPSEQARAGKTLVKLDRRTQHAHALVTMQIDLLREQRQALITAAVTGEFEVPGVAA